MEPNRRRKAGQAGPVENARPLPYVQVPVALLTLPTGERAAAIEVWAALHHYLRLGSTPRRITDEELASCPVLVERSRRYRCNGLDSLERAGLVAREAGGSSRRVAIVARLRGGRYNGVGGEATATAVGCGESSGRSRGVANREQVQVLPPPTFTSEEIAMAKRLFPKRCAGLVVPEN
jgi:hypothetical protein